MQALGQPLQLVDRVVAGLVGVAQQQLVSDVEVVLHHVQREELFSLSGEDRVVALVAEHCVEVGDLHELLPLDVDRRDRDVRRRRCRGRGARPRAVEPRSTFACERGCSLACPAGR